MLLGRARAAGWRIAVRGTDAARMDWLDQKLWQGPDEQFLPHGRSGGDHDADQPILLTTEHENRNAAACLMAIDGAAVSAEDVTAMARVCLMFDGNDAAALDGARGQWRDLTAAGCKAQYWSQQSGKWEKMTES